MYDDRKAEVKRLESKEKSLCNALGKECRKLPHSPLPTDEEMHEFKTYLEELSDLKFQNEEIFLRKKSSIIEIMTELKIVPSLHFERKIVLEDDSAFQVTDENMAMLEELHVSLKHQLEQTRIKIAEMRETLSGLWELLEESLEVRSKFLNAHPGNSVDTLKALKMEIVRCQEKKKENIKLFVDKMRQELVSWWDKCRYSPEQRGEFLNFESNCYTEDLLTLHELEIGKVKSFYENHKSIYDMVTKREQLWEKMKELERRANQPDRYKNRGGQLLREEKERKTISSQLPKIEQELLELVGRYEEENGRPFLISGMIVSDMIDTAWDEHKENKHVTLSARKNARENSRWTPSKSRIGTPRLPPSGTSMSTTKRKLGTPNFNTTKRIRVCDEKILRTAPSKLQINASSVKRASIERKKRIEKLKRRSHTKQVDHTIASTVSDYDGFEKGLQLNPKCRSSLFPEKAIQNVHQPSTIEVLHTPRKPLQGLMNTPQRTPSRFNLRPKSPMSTTNRLATAPGTLPIII